MKTPPPHPAPPAPPSHAARLHLSRAQWIGLPILMLVPLLALAGVFGERDTLATLDGGALRVAVRSPSLLRYRQRATLTVDVTNRGMGALDDVRVRLDPAYLDGFSGVAMSPQAAPDGTVPLGMIPPSSTSRLTVSLEGDRAGTRRGLVTVLDASGDSVRLASSTLVFP